jgi:hypothetical protein
MKKKKLKVVREEQIQASLHALYIPAFLWPWDDCPFKRGDKVRVTIERIKERK